MTEPTYQHVLSVDSSVSAADVQDLIDLLWEDFRNDPEYRQESLGDIPGLEDLADRAAAPFQARPEAEGLEAVTAILIGATGGVLAQYGVRGLDALWNRVVWPRLEKKFGDRIKR